LYVHGNCRGHTDNDSKDTLLPDIKTIQDDIRARLAEVERLIEPLRLEAEQLTKLSETFAAAGAPSAPPAAKPARAKTARKSPARASRPASSAPRAKRGRPAGGGNRAQQAIEHITKQPGITASELAGALGIGPNYLYRVLPQLQRDGKITKQGKGYHPAGSVEQTVSHANGQGVTA
jgi:hypothetical protein